jgi:NADPH:quinone reductase-like Zn-dependent oxidoreductase
MLKILLLLPLVPLLLNLWLRKEFKVHNEGVVLVTGASTGIGRHAAEALAASGYTVFAGVRKQKDAENIKSSNIPNLRPIILGEIMICNILHYQIIDDIYW